MNTDSNSGNRKPAYGMADEAVPSESKQFWNWPSRIAAKINKNPTTQAAHTGLRSIHTEGDGRGDVRVAYLTFYFYSEKGMIVGKTVPKPIGN